MPDLPSVRCAGLLKPSYPGYETGRQCVNQAAADGYCLLHHPTRKLLIRRKPKKRVIHPRTWDDLEER